ncbi:imidazole glycerol phosphate synthase subunit HisH [Ruminococcus sp.]|uniref:imidazole glycerol phosphate synthase subunit HisH n=1 Tax=Ruminococcus sp. TaxID=41978 RepID=UPI0025EEB756|nr:imidazole glycerol phosphate synthase subunit HisH [Ruminococcus sp.]MBQ8967878.1 imidazole glycerol phosphate synthase subunit HisH [Ruminococcus sp.]
MIAIVDYGAGNIFSVKNALDHLGFENKLTDKKEDIIAADRIILPGVGAFPWAMNMLKVSGLVDTIKEQAQQKPFMGICLGMQLIFDKSYEFEECAGLGLVGGYVDKITDPGLVIPHMGWNKLEYNRTSPLFEGLGNDEYVYFVHSYKAFCQDENLYAYCTYGSKVPAVVGDGKFVYGCQFHPEKSGETGLKILKNFAELRP